MKPEDYVNMGCIVMSARGWVFTEVGGSSEVACSRGCALEAINALVGGLDYVKTAQELGIKN